MADPPAIIRRYKWESATGDESILGKVRRGRVALARANGSSMTSHHKELEPIVQRRKRFGASTS